MLYCVWLIALSQVIVISCSVMTNRRSSSHCESDTTFLSHTKSKHLRVLATCTNLYDARISTRSSLNLMHHQQTCIAVFSRYIQDLLLRGLELSSCILIRGILEYLIIVEIFSNTWYRIIRQMDVQLDSWISLHFSYSKTVLLLVSLLGHGSSSKIIQFRWRRRFWNRGQFNRSDQL